MSLKPASQEESGSPNGLTPVHRRIHCPATPVDLEDNDELDEIAIENFLDALAEVALAVVRRRRQLDQ